MTVTFTSSNANVVIKYANVGMSTSVGYVGEHGEYPGARPKHYQQCRLCEGVWITTDGFKGFGVTHFRIPGAPPHVIDPAPFLCVECFYDEVTWDAQP